MLTYHPAYDTYHTAFRILKILNLNKDTSLEKDRVRMLDFLILFPHDLKNVRLPIEYKTLKNKHFESCYNQLPNRKKLFYQLGANFESSIQYLLAYGFLDKCALKKCRLRLTNNVQANKDILKFDEGFIDDSLMRLFKDKLIKMDLSELKKRIDLTEHKYDVSKD